MTDDLTARRAVAEARRRVWIAICKWSDDEAGSISSKLFDEVNAALDAYRALPASPPHMVTSSSHIRQDDVTVVPAK